jgi:hypothetical protein
VAKKDINHCQFAPNGAMLGLRGRMSSGISHSTLPPWRQKQNVEWDFPLDVASLGLTYCKKNDFSIVSGTISALFVTFLTNKMSENNLLFQITS